VHFVIVIKSVNWKHTYVYITEDMSSLSEMESWLPCLDNQEKLHQYLGLSDKKPIPDPVRFQRNDPLGSVCMSERAGEGAASGLCVF